MHHCHKLFTVNLKFFQNVGKLAAMLLLTSSPPDVMVQIVIFVSRLIRHLKERQLTITAGRQSNVRHTHSLTPVDLTSIFSGR
jgi:hypothetical protein